MEASEIPKIYTALISGANTLVANGAEDDETVEYIATEDMKIIGCALGNINAAKCLSHMTVARSGNQRMLFEYNSPRVITDADEPLFGTRLAFEDPSNNTDFCSKEWMLPSGSWFELEEGERIYLHSHFKNNDASSHTFKSQALLYYQKG